MKRRHCSHLAGGLILAMVGAAPAAEFYVDAGNNSGTELGTQGSPFRTVQAGIDAAAGGDEVRVAAGTYTENLRIEGKAIVLQGGYSSAWERDVAANTTTLSGAGGNAVINIIAADATIDGFRITGGTGSTEELPYGYHGGGIYSSGGSPTITNNVIEDNDIRNDVPPEQNYHFGGGVNVTNAATATIVDNVVRGNYAGRGAGVSVTNVQEARIERNTIEGNVAIGDHGGGLYIAVADARITQNIIRRNEVGRELTYGWGGGLIVFNPGNFAEISFNQVYENYAAGYGAGEFIDEGAEADIHHELIYRNESKDGCEVVSAISVDGGDGVGSRVTISHVTVVGNVCENAIRGNGLQVENLSEATVTNSIFWNNSGNDFAVDNTSMLSVTYTNTEEGFTGTGNISADPLFVDESADDFRLAPGSPSIDAADPASPFDDEPDNGGRADMGRFGNAAEEPPADDPNENDNSPDDDDDDGGPAVSDRDGDGVPDSQDNCPGVANTDQDDTDEDGIGDACDSRGPGGSGGGGGSTACGLGSVVIMPMLLMMAGLKLLRNGERRDRRDVTQTSRP